MKILKTYPEIRAWRTEHAQTTVGFVPTMGALHAGHASLFDRSIKENTLSVASIFVNPTQFNDPNDLAKYPRTFEADCDVLRHSGVDVVLYPEVSALYPQGTHCKVTESPLSQDLCGAHRPGHFEGVLTVVLKLLNWVTPTRTYFGEKDFQQYLLIKKMAEDFFIPTQIIPCETVRAPDGLALSSRNVRLSAEGRKKAPLLFEFLHSSPTAQHAEQRIRENGFEVDYIKDIEGRRFAAVTLEGVRLIDNVKI